MTTDQLIALSASLGAFVSAFATFLTIREMKRQREDSYRPELVFMGSAFECISDPKIKGKVPIVWHPSLNGVRQDTTSYFTYVSLYNIGLGSAKNLQITWDYPFSILVSELNNLTNKYFSTSFFRFENGVLFFDSETHGNMVSNWRTQQQCRLNYVLPSSTKTDSLQVTLPHAYILIVSAIVYFGAITEDIEMIENIPELKVHIDYYDIANKKHSVNYSFNFSPTMFAGNGESIHCYLESKSTAKEV
jgi:hypothetical protein